MAPPITPPAFGRLLALRKRDANFLHGFVTALALAPHEWQPQQALDVLGQVEFEPGEETLPPLLDSVDEAIGALARGTHAPLLDAGPVVYGIARWQAGFDLAVSLDTDSWEAQHENDLAAGEAFVHLITLSRPDIAEALYGITESEHSDYVREQLAELPELLAFLYVRYHSPDPGIDLDVEEIDPALFELPEFSNEELAALDAEATFQQLIELGDLVPRSLFDHAVALGDDIIPLLRAHFDNPLAWNDGEDDEESGLWWGLHHAAYVLGMQNGAAAGEALVHVLRQQQRYPYDELWMWLGEAWPFLFANKDETLVPQLQAIMADEGLDDLLRVNAMQALTELCRQLGNEALERQLDGIAVLCEQAEAGSNLEDLSAMHLLDFPRPRHRALLETKARRFVQREAGVPFELDEVTWAFDRGGDNPESDRFAEPWQFYDEEAIRQRQARWLRETAEEYLDQPDDFDDPWLDDLPVPETFQREQPKVGRNDPCPCGSGKKYKKCCLH